MMIWIKSVDPAWFDFVSTRPAFEINLWAPTSHGLFKGAASGDLILFHVNGRKGWIAGSGVFVESGIYFAEDAWDMFEEQNGVATYQTFMEQIRKRRATKREPPYAVACHAISEPIFFNPLRASVPSEALRRLGSGPISERSENGTLLLSFLREAESASSAQSVHERTDASLPPDQRARLGRGGFRLTITNAYDGRCAITGNTVLPCLEAVHWIPDQVGGPMIVQNGSLLRRDFHPLVERGFITLSDDYRLLISAWLPRLYDNSEAYLGYNGVLLSLPRDRQLWPDLALLQQHRRDIFYKGGSVGR